MEAMPGNARERQITPRGLLITVAALAVPCSALCSGGVVGLISVVLTIYLGPVALAMFGLWLFPVGPCPLEPYETNHDHRNRVE